MNICSVILWLATAGLGAWCWLPVPVMPGWRSQACHTLPALVTITTRLLSTVPTTNVHVAFQEDSDPCMLARLWNHDVGVKVATQQHLWPMLQGASYTQPAQYILVGDLAWIMSIIEKARIFYTDATLNDQKTYWFWVVTQDKPSAFLPSPGTTDSPNVVTQVEALLFEGLHGLLIYEDLKHEPTAGQSRRVLVDSTESPGDGSSHLRLAAAGTSRDLDILRPLWPAPPFDLMGRTLRINCLKKPTVFLFNDGEKVADAQGYAADIVQEIQRRLNFTDVLVPNTGFGAYRNGSWNGMVGDLLYGRADVSPMDFTPIWQRSLVIDFGRIYSTDNVVIISRAPRAFIRPLLLLQIFTPFVWGSLLVVAMAAGVALSSMVMARRSVGVQDQETSQGMFSYCLVTFSIFVYQSSTMWPRWLGGRLVGGSLMLAAVVVGSLYSGSITAFLTIPSRSSPINSLEELLERNLVPAIRRLSSPYSFFLTENSGQVGARVRQVMVVFSGAEVSRWDFLKMVADGTYAFIDTASSAIGRSGQYEKVGQPCLFYIGRNPVRMDLDAFAYPKNSPVKYQFDEVMRWLQNHGIIEHLKGQYYSQSCGVSLASDGPTSISLNQAQGAFYVLGIGLAVSLTTLFLEVVFRGVCVPSCTAHGLNPRDENDSATSAQ